MLLRLNEESNEEYLWLKVFLTPDGRRTFRLHIIKVHGMNVKTNIEYQFATNGVRGASVYRARYLCRK